MNYVCSKNWLALIVVIAGVCQPGFALAESCMSVDRKSLPKCVSWQLDPVMGVEIRNRCRFPVSFVVVAGGAKKQSVPGGVAPDETVIAAMSMDQKRIRGVFCCSDKGRC